MVIIFAADKPPRTVPKQGGQVPKPGELGASLIKGVRQGKSRMRGQQAVRVVVSVSTKRRSGLMRWMAACSSVSKCLLIMTLFKLIIEDYGVKGS
jgi:hypothetical protein